MSYELPPMAQGTAEQQLDALRDYLVRLARSLEQVCGSEAIVSAAGRAADRAQTRSAAEVKAAAEGLKALIVKTADEVTAYADAKREEYSALYVAKSDYGTYYNLIQTQVEQTARQAVESYRFTEALEGLESALSDLSGRICRGVIEDPETHERHLGIAISESLSFTGQEQNEGGHIYYELSPGQTLGLYTAEGWQFWIGGVRRGWFSSEDSMLHVSNIVVENRLQLGADWEITTEGGFGLRWIGG